MEKLYARNEQQLCTGDRGTSCELSFVKHGSIGKVFDVNSNNCTIKNTNNKNKTQIS